MAKDFEFVGTINVKDIHAGLDSIEKRMQQVSKNVGKSWGTTGDEIRKDVKKTQTQVRRSTEETSKAFLKLNKAQRLNIRQGAFALQRFGLQGAAAWGEIFAAAGVAGVGIGAVLITVLALGKAFKAMASAAVNAFKTITKQGVAAAKEYEIAGAQFKAVMQGNEKAAEAVLKRIQTLSRQVGQNLTGVARAFLPEVENLDQLDDILKIATALAQYQPEQGILGARIALQEFLSGETRSLRRRFEIPQTDIERMKDAFNTGGIGAAIDELNAFLAKTGRSLEDLSDTAEVSFNRLKEGWRQVLVVYGTPIIESAKTQADDLGESLAVLKPKLDAVAAAFGEVVGQVVELIGHEINDFIKNVDFDNILNFATALGDAATAFGTLVEQMALGETSAAGFNSVTELLTLYAFKLEGAFLRAAVSVARLRRQFTSFFKDMGRESGIAEKVFRSLEGALDYSEIGSLEYGLQGLFNLLGDVSGVAYDAAVGFEDADVSLTGLTESVEEYNKKLERLAAGESIFDIIADEEPEVFEEMAEGILARSAANEELTSTLIELAEAEEELAEIYGDFADKAQKKRDAIETRYKRAKDDAETRATRRAIEIEKQKLDKLADLGTSWQKRLLAIRTDLSRDEEDIARRHGRKTIQIEEDLANDKIKIQEDYLRKLDEINRRFDFDAQEAARANDAIAFLRIQRRRKFELNEAKINRDDDLEDVDDNAEKQREDLQDTYAQEIEDARIANTRKLEDLNTWLNQQTEAIDVWEQRQEEKRLQRLADAEEDAWESQVRQSADFVKWWLDMNIETNKGAGTLEDRIAEMLDTIAEHLRNFPSFRNLIDPELLEFLGFSRTGRGGRGIGGTRGTPSGRGRGGQRTGVPEDDRTPTSSKIPSTYPKPPLPSPEHEEYPGYTPKEEGIGFPGLNELPAEELKSMLYSMGLDLGYHPEIVYADISISDLDELRELVLEYQGRIEKYGKVEGRREGGPVRSGKPVLVGEPLPGGRPNPEVFIPDKDGYIVPMHKLDKMSAARPTDTFSPTDTTLRQMYFSPPFMAGSRGSRSVDNSKSVTVVNPEVDTGLSPIQIAQIKQMYTQLRLEEQLV